MDLNQYAFGLDWKKILTNLSSGLVRLFFIYEVIFPTRTVQARQNLRRKSLLEACFPPND